MDKMYCENCKKREGKMCCDGIEPVEYYCVIICSQRPGEMDEEGFLVVEPTPGRKMRIDISKTRKIGPASV